MSSLARNTKGATDTTGRKRPIRGVLTRHAILRAAVELADRDGLEALSMRRLAASLGVEAMALYYHTADKQDLLDGIADSALDEIEVPSPSADWRPAVRSSSMSRREVFGRHPWAAELLMSSTRLGPARLRQMEALLAALRAGGFSGELLDHAYHVIDIYVAGMALWEARFARTVHLPLSNVAATVLRDLPADTYPEFASHIAFHLQQPAQDKQGAFELGLDLLLEGLERARLEVSDEAAQA